MGLLALVALLSAPVVALADAGGPQIVVDDRATEGWQAAARKLTSTLAGRADIDRRARVDVLGAGTEAIVHVTLPDGRGAVRRLRDPAELRVTVEALLLLPPALPAKQREAAVPDAAPAPAGAPPPSGAHAEIGLAGTAHLTIAPAYFGYGMGGFVQVVSERWVIGVGMRWDVDDVGTGQTLPDGFNMQLFQVGALAGRRFVAGGATIDALAGPAIAVENQEALKPTDPEGFGGTRADAAVVVAGRITLPRASAFRFYAEISGDAFPTRFRASRRLDPVLPVLPPWGVGIAVGIVWGE